MVFVKMIEEVAKMYDLQHHVVSDSGQSRTRWQQMVQAAVLKQEVNKWRQRLAEKEMKDGSLGAKWYRELKPAWGEEKYVGLRGAGQQKGVKLRALMRFSRAPLAGLLMDFEKEKAGEPRPHSNICRFCDSGATEDQTHVLRECTRHAKARQWMELAVQGEWQRGSGQHETWWRKEPKAGEEMTAREQAVWLLRYEGEHVSREVNSFLVRLFATRRAVDRIRGGERRGGGE
jgi:hypothetical protein